MLVHDQKFLFILKTSILCFFFFFNPELTFWVMIIHKGWQMWSSQLFSWIFGSRWLLCPLFPEGSAVKHSGSFSFLLSRRFQEGPRCGRLSSSFKKEQWSGEAQLVWTSNSEACRFMSSGWDSFCSKAMAWSFVSDLWPQKTLWGVENAGLTCPSLGKPTAPWKLLYSPPLLPKVPPITEGRRPGERSPEALQQATQTLSILFACLLLWIDTTTKSILSAFKFPRPLKHRANDLTTLS